MTKLLRCTCQHAYQDQQYGKGMRVHNEAKVENEQVTWRCTVCGAVHTK